MSAHMSSNKSHWPWVVEDDDWEEFKQLLIDQEEERAAQPDADFTDHMFHEPF